MRILDPNRALKKLVQTMKQIPGVEVQFWCYPDPPLWTVFFCVAESQAGWTALKTLTEATRPPDGEMKSLELRSIDVIRGDRLVFFLQNVDDNTSPDDCAAIITAQTLIRSRGGSLSPPGGVM